jgi:hypothetical protein
MKGAAGAAAAEFEVLLPRIADSMRRPAGTVSMDGAMSMDAADDRDVTFALDTQLSAVGVARAATASLLRRWHITTGAYDILLRLINHLDNLVCVVADPNTTAPVLREPDFVAETGRGLHVVQSYSRQWGWALCPSGQGKIVWALF